jgi:hypothetical protein
MVEIPDKLAGAAGNRMLPVALQLEAGERPGVARLASRTKESLGLLIRRKLQNGRLPNGGRSSARKRRELPGKGY